MSGQQPIYVGISSTNFDYFAAAQENSNWCWAASLQMIFNYYGVNINQEDIVRKSYGTDPFGNLPNWTGSFNIVTANLNNWSVDNSGKAYSVRASLNWGAPVPAYLIQELSSQRPVLIGYRSGPTSGHAVVITACSYIQTNSGHAVVITACSYIQTNSGPLIQSIIVRDPFPTDQNIANKGRIEYHASNLPNLIQAHWYVRIQ